jgi:hypothetical protein
VYVGTRSSFTADFTDFQSNHDLVRLAPRHAALPACDAAAATSR